MNEKESTNAYHTQRLTQNEPAKKPVRWTKKHALIVIVALLVIIVGLSTYLVLRETGWHGFGNDMTVDTTAQAVALKEKVSRHMVTPDEIPVLATVQSADALTGQTLFANAQDGDKVLIFTQAKLAIVYRESEDKIVSSGSITINSNEPSDL